MTLPTTTPFSTSTRTCRDPLSTSGQWKTERRRAWPNCPSGGRGRVRPAAQVSSLLQNSRPTQAAQRPASAMGLDWIHRERPRWLPRVRDAARTTSPAPAGTREPPRISALRDDASWHLRAAISCGCARWLAGKDSSVGVEQETHYLLTIFRQYHDTYTALRQQQIFMEAAPKTTTSCNEARPSRRSGRNESLVSVTCLEKFPPGESRRRTCFGRSQRRTV